MEELRRSFRASREVARAPFYVRWPRFMFCAFFVCRLSGPLFMIVGCSSMLVGPEIVRDGRETSFPVLGGRFRAARGGGFGGARGALEPYTNMS